MRCVQSWMALALGALAASAALGAEEPLSPLVGRKNVPSVSRGPGSDSHRGLEIAVELAWLANPITFPYSLEARVDCCTLEVHGDVPSKAVRDQALNIARRHSPIKVVDAIRESPSQVVRPDRLPPAQLQSAACTALREAFPAGHQRFVVQCTRDAKVIVRGAVRRPEEKLAVSRTLHRLPGCAAVHNQLEVIATGPLPAVSPAPNLALGPTYLPALPSPSGNTIEPPVQTLPAIVLVSHVETTPRLKPPIPGVEPPPNPQASRPVAALGAPQTSAQALSAKLIKRIEQVCPGAKDVRVRLDSNCCVTIELPAPTEETGIDFIRRIAALPELAPYAVEFYVVLPPRLTPPVK